MAGLSEPVVVLIKSKHCSHCLRLEAIWDKVMVAIKQVYPKMRFASFMLTDPSVFDETVLPSGLKAYRRWFPMTLLVPGMIWDQAMANIRPNSNVEIKDGVQIFNGIMSDGVLNMNMVYDGRSPSGYVSWIRDVIKNENFTRVQNAQGNQAQMFTPQFTQSLITPIVEPVVETTSKIVKHPVSTCGLNLGSRHGRPYRRF